MPSKFETPHISPADALSAASTPTSPPSRLTASDRILSSMPLSDWRGSITTFKGFTGTRPASEQNKVSWAAFSGAICPPKPAIHPEKKNAQYCVPCQLKEAPLVGNTLAMAEQFGTSLTGKMRSKTHVTEASCLIIDLDGLAESEFNAGLGKLAAASLTYTAFTTHSHGSGDKPGIRARLAVALDRPVAAEGYAAAWHGLDQHFFDGRAGQADSSGANLYQQQGTWCVHPDRVDQARSWRNNGGVAAADALIAIGRSLLAAKAVPCGTATASPENTRVNPKCISATTYPSSTVVGEYPVANANKVADACQQIGAFRDTKGTDQSEPLWYDCLGVVCYCENGESYCHEWSGGHSGYDVKETAKKVEYRMKVPPTTCAQFHKSNPAGCSGCAKQCNSPITLGWENQPQETFEVVEPAEVAVAPLGHPNVTDAPAKHPEMGDAIADDDPPNALATIQEQYALINMEGKVWVLDRRSLSRRNDSDVAKKLTLSNRSDGQLLIVRAIKAAFPGEDAQKVSAAFMSSPQTTCYDGVEFNPKGTTPNYFNLWVGPVLIPVAGGWLLIRSFMLTVLCDGDQAAYDYLIRYIAHALQFPEEKPGVIIILIGGQGTGKGTFARILQKAWSATYLHVHDINSVTGNFNGALERAFIVFMDEALFVGDRRASDALKSLITEPVIQINEKHQPARQSRSYHRFIAATNADHFKNTERDDRRDFVLRVSDARKGDSAYWTTLNNEIENGGVAAMIHDLLAMDLSGFNVRQKPNTKELLAQKLQSLGPIEHWWFACLKEGYLVQASSFGTETWPNFVATNTVIDDAVAFCGVKIFRKPSSVDAVKTMLRLCPSATQKQQQVELARHRGFSLPSLEQARLEFDAYIGGQVDWALD